MQQWRMHFVYRHLNLNNNFLGTINNFSELVEMYCNYIKTQGVKDWETEIGER